MKEHDERMRAIFCLASAWAIKDYRLSDIPVGSTAKCKLCKQERSDICDKVCNECETDRIVKQYKKDGVRFDLINI